MVTIPTLPTDSIYKFTFVAGIVFVIFSLYLLNENSNQVNTMAVQVDSVLESHNVQANATIKGLDNRLKILLKVQKAGDAILKERNISTNFSLTNKQIWDNLERDLKFSEMSNTKDSMAKMRQFNDELLIKRLDRTVFKIWHIGVICVILGIGLLMIGYGYFMWYYRIQLPQDRLLHMQVLQMEKQLKESKCLGRSHFEPQILPRRKLSRY